MLTCNKRYDTVLKLEDKGNDVHLIVKDKYTDIEVLVGIFKEDDSNKLIFSVIEDRVKVAITSSQAV